MADDDLSDPPRRSYRAKLINPDGSIETSIAVMAETLQEAEEQARGLTFSYDVEIWDGGQMVKQLPFRRPR